jgi:hypothetical protein
MDDMPAMSGKIMSFMKGRIEPGICLVRFDPGRSMIKSLFADIKIK